MGRLPSLRDQGLGEIAVRVPRYTRLAWRLFREPRVPLKSRFLVALGGAYALSPLDGIPGFIPVAGQLDDLWVLLSALEAALKDLPSALREGLLAAAGVTMEQLRADRLRVRGTLVEWTRHTAAAVLRVITRAGAWGLRATWRAGRRVASGLVRRLQR